jgi:putative colanic acid biosynthesis glycosyltransferase WcaI
MALRSTRPERSLCLMPHLLVFNRSYHPDLGATGQLLGELCEDLVSRHGWRVTVVAGPPTVTLDNGTARLARRRVRQETVRGVTVLRTSGTRLPKARFVGRVTNYLSYFAAALLAGFRVPRPDLVMSLTDPPVIGLAAAAWARWWGVPFVFLCQDVFPEVAVLLEDFRSERVNRLLDRVNRLLLREAAAVVAIGETMARRLVELKGAAADRVTVIHNWADRAVLGPERKKNAFAEANGLSDRFVVLHSGNLGLGQAAESLVEAAGHLRSQPDLVFVFQGDGVKRAALADQVKRLGLDNVRFLPYASKDTLRYAFGAADVQVVSLRRGLAGFIVPSKFYGILASGRASVAAVEDDCEVATLTTRHGSGLVVPPGEPAAIAAAIRRLYDDPELRARLAANALEASAAYDRPGAVAAYHRLLSGLVAGARVRRGWLGGWAKRAFDVGLSGAGLLGSLPLWAAIGLAVRRQDGGPVFFRDERVGQGGRVFGVLKFRTMVPDADRLFGPKQAGENDPRVTRVGRLLRATAMDELPQLWNIFRGDMSFVGPRALRPGEIHARGDGRLVPLASVPGYRDRHAVRPGLTGVAQIYADRDVPPHQKFRYDRLYIRRRSFGLDLRLIALSFWITFRGRWERRGRKT